MITNYENLSTVFAVAAGVLTVFGGLVGLAAGWLLRGRYGGPGRQAKSKSSAAGSEES